MTVVLVLVIYAIGLVLALAAAFWAARRENTTHGRIAVGQIGCSLAVQWPLALVYFAIVGVVLLTRRGFRAVREWLR